MSSESIVHFRQLSDSAIEEVEQALKSDKLKSVHDKCYLSVSLQYYNLAELSYKEIIDEKTPVTSYCQFASNGYGFQSYGFYKAKDGNVYIIDSFTQDINAIYIPNKNIDFLSKL